MNLKELREEINAQLDYNPDLKQYRDIVSRVINRHYLQISSQYPWLFMQNKENLTLKPDVAAATASASGSTLYLQRHSNNPRYVEFYEASTGGSAVTTAGFLNKSTTDGQTLVVTISGTDHEYLITQSSGLTNALHVEPLAGSDELPVSLSTTRSADWKIEYRKYPLPRDCVEILGVNSRDDDKGRLIFIDSKKEELLYLDRDNTGDSVVLVEEMAGSDPPPPAAPIAELSPVGITATDESRTILATPTVEYCYTFLYAGRESAPSPVVTFTLADHDPSEVTPYYVKLRGLIRSSWRPDPDNNNRYSTGRRKRIYRRFPLTTNKPGFAMDHLYGVWVHVEDVDSDAPVFTDDGRFTSMPDGDIFKQAFSLSEPGPRQYIRAYRTPNAEKKVEVRYAVRPTRMSADGDQPLWPGQYHHLLVYKVLEDLCLMHGMNAQAGIYERRALELLKRMKDKYLSRTDRPYIRGSFERSLFSYRYRERWGVPSKS